MSYHSNLGLYEGFIYIVTNQLNGLQYIGQTRRTIEKRWRIHLRSLNSDINYFHNAIKKYGAENFIVNVLDITYADNIETLSKKLDNLEIYHIAHHNTLFPNGYNLTKGGGNNSINCSKAVDQYDKYGNFIRTYDSATEAANITNGSRKGITDCCTKVVDKRNKRTYSSGGYIWRFNGDTDIQDSLNKSCQRPVVQYDINGNIIQHFYNIKEAHDVTGIISESILNCCNGKSKSAGGYVFLYYGNNFVKPKLKNIKPVNCYDLNDNFICHYDSIQKAQNFLGINGSDISACCNKRQKTSHGYKWYHADDKTQPDKTKIIC